MTTSGPGDRPPKHRVVPVRAHTRKITPRKKKPEVAPGAAPYVSQGEAVEKVANQQRALARAQRASQPVQRAKHEAVAKAHVTNARRADAVRDARANVAVAPVNRPGLPPEVRHPPGSTQPKGPPPRPLSMVDVLDKGRFVPNDADLQRQRQHAIDAGVAHLMTRGRSLTKQDRTIERLKQLGAVPGTSEFQRAVNRFNARQSAQRERTHRPESSDLLLTDPQALREAGFRKAGALDKAIELPLRVLPTLAAGAYQTGRAAYEDPGAVIPRTAGGIAKATVGIIPGLVEAAVHPVAAAKAIVADYERRYGDVLKDPEAFRARIKKEGATGEVFDIATVLAAGGTTLGRAAQGLAEKGKLGKRAERVATSRPELQVSGNLVREQPVSENLIRNVGRAAVDTARGKATARRAAREDAPLEDVLAQQSGRVTYLTRAGARKAQRVDLAREGGAARPRQKAQQQEELKRGRALVGTLSEPEKRGLKHQIQINPLTPAAARATLETRIDLAAAHRAARKSLNISRRTDELDQLRWLHEHADEVFTPKLRQVARDLQSQERRQIHVGDPGVDPVQAQLRRSAAQAQVLDPETKAAVRPSLEFAPNTRPFKQRTPDGKTETFHTPGRGVIDKDGRLHTWYEDEGTHIERGLDKGEGFMIRPDGTISVHAGSGRMGDHEIVARAVAQDPRLKPPKDWDTRPDAPGPMDGTGKTYPNFAQELARAKADLGGRVEGRSGTPPAHATPVGIERGTKANVDEAATNLAQAQERVTRLRDQQVTGKKMDEAVATRDAARARADRLGEHEGESHAQYLRRVARARRSAGLGRPGYFPSEERPRGVFATMALGGRKATDIPKEYSGTLFKRATESSDPEILHRGVSRTIKRREQWNLVGRNFEKHTVASIADRETGKPLPMRDRTIQDLTRSLENAGVDPDTVGFWNPRKFYEASKRSRAAEEGGVGDVAGVDTELHPRKDNDIRTALQNSIARPHELQVRGQDFADSGGWSVVPREVLDEMETQAQGSNFAGRAFDISKGKVSRVLLGNPAWLSLQVGSNVLMTGLAGAGPATAIEAARWWRKLPLEQKRALEPELGIHGWYDEQTHLGAASNARMVNAYRAFKTTPFYRRAHLLNPLDLIFRADNAQNNLFRKTVAYNEAKKEAYKRMGRNASALTKTQQDIQRVLRQHPDKAILDALKDPAVFERHAEKVRDFLGDYTTYTARERRYLGRYAMFYGFLRNSLRMAFYTMPVKHPVMTAIGLQLGKLHDAELQKLFGAGNVPAWEQGNAFIGGKKFPLARLNPFFNAVQYQGPGSLMMLGSPFISIMADQIASKNVSFDRLWKTQGSTQYVTSGKDINLTDRARIALAAVLHLSPYVRAAEKTGIPGVAEPLVGAQSDTSSILFPEPTRYKQGPKVASNQRRVEAEEAKTAGKVLQEQFFPLAGQSATQTVESARSYARSQGKDVPGPTVATTPAQRRAIQRARRNAARSGGGGQARALARARRAAATR